jgi:hypothetical protein
MLSCSYISGIPACVSLYPPDSTSCRHTIMMLKRAFLAPLDGLQPYDFRHHRTPASTIVTLVFLTQPTLLTVALCPLSSPLRRFCLVVEAVVTLHLPRDRPAEVVH